MFQAKFKKKTGYTEQKSNKSQGKTAPHAVDDEAKQGKTKAANRCTNTIVNRDVSAA